jgi:lipopolysaccharide transport system ATP-binding protein
MTNAITAEKLSKQYRIGELKGHTTLRDALGALFRRNADQTGSGPDTIWALKDVTFNVEQSEVLGIVGRNGAGKSTLLKVLSRITYPTRGQLQVNGRVASLLEVGTGFHSELTGRENIYLNGSILGMSKREINAQFDAIVSFAGVERFIDTPIKRYSSGMQLRLGFAVAAHLRSDVLFVDEVLAVGDAEFQKKCLDAMSDLHGGGRTVLFVSHNMAAVENLCPRAIWIDGGQIRQDGPAKDVIRAYLSTFGTAQAGGADLRQIVSRSGTGEVQFTSMEFLDADRHPKPVICSGDKLVIRCHYRVRTPVQNPHFGFELHTELGTHVTDISTWSTGLDIPELTEGQGHADLEIDFLNLMPGRYYVSLWLESVGGLRYDLLNRCAAMDVETSDYYNSGRGIEGQFGLVFFPCRWTLHPAGS